MTEKRSDVVEVSLTPSEKAEIVAAARSEGMQASPFMRTAALRLARSGQ